MQYFRFRTNQGDILINGRGLNGNSVNILDIVARSVVLERAGQCQRPQAGGGQ
jgi:hypothetical protein